MKTSWKIFWDLQCPYSRVNWKNMPALREKFGDEYDFSIHLTSLAFHPQAFLAQCGASLIKAKKGRDAQLKYVDACFEKQETFMNAAIGDAKKSEIAAVFALIAEGAGIFDDTFKKEDFLAGLNDWESAVYPAYTEHKIALGFDVYSTPSHVINDKLVPATESSWGADDWADKLKTL
jgi:protein-disulfide isomerase